MLHQTCQAQSTDKIQQIQVTYLTIGTEYFFRHWSTIDETPAISGEVRKPAQSSVALHTRDLFLKRFYNLEVD